jgi:polysaccharide biosynthesis/export protein
MRHFSKIRGFRFTLALLVVFTLAAARKAGCETQSPAPASVTVPAAPSSGAAATSVARPPSVPVIGAGDLLKVSVLGAPESDQEVRVGADGNAFLNFIGSVHVAGLTTEQAQATVAKSLVAGGFFTQPQVSVFEKEYATQGVSVLGEVWKPGVYPLLGSRTLFDVISLAGGTTPKAGKVVSITHRDNPQQATNVSLSNDTAESVHSNIEVYPGDTVLVSKAGIVYIVGDVHKPSGVTMDNGAITVLQAIAMAEGTNPTASLNKAKLIRTTSTGREELPLLLKDMLSSKAPDVHLQAEDIIFVPTSAAKSAGKRTMEAIVQAATGVVIYGAR